VASARGARVRVLIAVWAKRVMRQTIRTEIRKKSHQMKKARILCTTFED
jgi:hypothetical protein